MNMVTNTLVVKAGLSRQSLLMDENTRKEALIDVCPVCIDIGVIRVHVHKQRNKRD